MPTKFRGQQATENKGLASCESPSGFEKQDTRIAAAKPAAERLYGRTRGNTLRQRQQLLLQATLPRLRLHPEDAGHPAAAFPVSPAELWLEVGFGGGEHARAQVQDNPQAGLIAAEVYANGICSLLSALVPERGEATAPLPPNLLVWDDDARLLLRADAGRRALSRVFLLFPDPLAEGTSRQTAVRAPRDAAARCPGASPRRRMAHRVGRPDLPGLDRFRAGGAALVLRPAPIDRAASGVAADALRGEGPPSRPDAAVVGGRANRIAGGGRGLGGLRERHPAGVEGREQPRLGVR